MDLLACRIIDPSPGLNMKLLIVTASSTGARADSRTDALIESYRSRGHDVARENSGRAAGAIIKDNWFDLVVEDLTDDPLHVAKWVKRRPVLVLPPDLFPGSSAGHAAPDYLGSGFVAKRRARCYRNCFFVVPDEPGAGALVSFGVESERIQAIEPMLGRLTGPSTDALPAPALDETNAARWRQVMEGVYEFSLEIIENHRAWY